MKTIHYTLFLLFMLYCGKTFSQDDLLALLDESDPVTEYATASFKTNRVINLHSLENTAAGVMDFKISHRFGFINGGISELFGLDAAMIRFGFDYGITNRLSAGIGRSSYQKTYDGFLKYTFLRQSKGAKNCPVTAAVLSTAAIQTLPWQNPDRENYFSSRLYYTWQLIAGRKFNDQFSLQVSPTVVHRNLVGKASEANDVFAVGIAARQKITRRLAINTEYIYVAPDQLASGYRNSFSIGFDIETGGHVFQLHFTNSTAIIEKGFIGETTGTGWMAMSISDSMFPGSLPSNAGNKGL